MKERAYSLKSVLAQRVDGNKKKSRKKKKYSNFQPAVNSKSHFSSRICSEAAEVGGKHCPNCFGTKSAKPNTSFKQNTGYFQFRCIYYRSVSRQTNLLFFLAFSCQSPGSHL